MGPTDDSALVEAAARGDREALGQLYDQHAGTMYAVAVRILNDAGAAEDLVHDVFIEAWRAAASFDHHRGSVRAWLVMRLRSRALDRLRSRAKHKELCPVGVLESEEKDPANGVDAGRVRAWVSELPPEQREALELAYFGGCSIKEIAAQQDVPVGTVKARISRAVARLRSERGQV